MTNFKHITTLLLACFIASLFWCGDADCTNGSDEENCSCFACSFSDTSAGTTQNASSQHDDSCNCVCHVPNVAPGSINVVAYQPTSNAQDISTLYAPSSPCKNVYHPPLPA